VAIDHGDELLTESLVGRLREVVEGTEYAVFALYLEAVIAGSVSGPLEELEILQAMQLAIQDSHQPVLARLLHDTERAAALIQLGSVGAAREAVSEIESIAVNDDSHMFCSSRLGARLALHTGDFEGVLAATSACRSLGDRHAPRTLAQIDVLRSAAHDGLGDAGIAAETMDRALLQAARTGWRRHFTMLPQDRLASMLDAAGKRDQPPAALAVLDELHDHLSPVSSESIPPLSSRERLILGHIVAGESRQQMSSQLSVSPNTIKTQVRSIYRKLGASNRHEAIDRAAKYGITA
jgi:ATP/maltotriose-dependent transcriptional regulator MalT